MASSVLNLLHQNIRCLRANFDIFSVYLSSLKTQSDLIFVSEIWIYSNESSQFNLPNYNFKACCNDSYRSGGVGVFISKNFFNVSVQYCNWPSADVLVMDLKLGKDDWTFICIYRFYGKSITAFCIDLERMLQTINRSNIVMLGDLNIDLLDGDECFYYQTMLASYGLQSLLNDPTRNIACLDHIFVKSVNKYDFDIGNLPINFSDHNLIQLNILSSTIPVVPRDNVSFTSHIDYNKLRAYLLLENWDSVYLEGNCNSAFENFIATLKSHIESSKFTTGCRNIKNLKPWMNSFLLVKINKLKKYSKKLKKHPNNIRLQKFVKKLSKGVNIVVKTAKNLYYKQKFDSVGNNSKQTWKVIDDVLGKKKETTPITKIYQCQSNTLITDSQLISNEFNKFFLNISSDIVSKLGKDTSNANVDEFKSYILGSS